MVSRAKSSLICEIAGKCQASARGIELRFGCGATLLARAEPHNALLLKRRQRGRSSGFVSVSVNESGGANSRNREVTGTQGVRSDELTRAQGDL